MQIIILALLENFEFSLPQNEKTKIYRKPSQVMLPVAKGEKGCWMCLFYQAAKLTECSHLCRVFVLRPGVVQPTWLISQCLAYYSTSLSFDGLESEPEWC